MTSVELRLKSLFAIKRIKPLSAVNVDHDGTEFEIHSEIVSKFVIIKLVPIVGVTPYPLCELSLMVAAVCYHRPSHILEWGTGMGKSARIFLEIAKGFKLNTEIHSIDLPDTTDHPEHPRAKRGYYVKGIRQVTLHQGDGVSNAIDLCNSLNKVIRPFFFLDGDHEYESVKRELQLIDENVTGATIMVHDTFFQSEESGYNIGPFLAIQEFLLNRPGKYRRVDTHLGLPGMTLLYQNR